MIRFRVSLIYWVIALGFFIPGAAHAYIDPATTTYIIQIVTALVVTVGVSLSVFMYRFRMISAKVRYGVYGLLRRFAPRKNGSIEGDGLLRRFAPSNDGRAGGAGSSARQRDVSGASQGDGQPSCVAYALPGYAIPGAAHPPTEEEMEALGVDADMARIESKSAELDEPGKRGYFGRLRAALPVSLAVCLTFVFLGCIDLAAQNSMDMPFTIAEVAPIVFACFATCFAVFAFAVPLARGRLFEIILSLAVIVLIAGYIQGNFLNKGLGELTGDEIVWGVFRGMMAGSTVFWACLAAAIFLLRRFSRPAWRGLTVFAPFLLIVIQSVALLSVFGAGIENRSGIYGTEWGGTDETLSIAGIDELASGNNAVVFLIDRLDEEFVDEIEQMDPAFFDRLDGFTKFEDNISYYVSTFPSVAGMLTGQRYYFDEPVSEYFDRAWANAELIRELKAHGADIRIYMMAKGYIYDRPEQLHGVASNILVPEYEVEERVALVKLLKLSAFRYAPMPAKPTFWLSPTEFADTIVLTSDASPYIINDTFFYDRLVEHPLKETEGEASFTYIHLLGAHDPITIDENLQKNAQSTPARQAMGVFKIVYEYIDQMKALGLYEDATIVITGDHGVLQGDGVFRPALTGLFVKPAGSYGTPLAYSRAPVCPDELVPTILTSMFGEGVGGGEGSSVGGSESVGEGGSGGFGQTYFDIKEGDPAVREYISNIRRYEIRGDGRDFANWEYTGELENKIGWNKKGW